MVECMESAAKALDLTLYRGGRLMFDDCPRAVTLVELAHTADANSSKRTSSSPTIPGHGQESV